MGSKPILIITFVTLGSALEPTSGKGEIQNVLQKYIQNVDDIDSKYVINEALSKSISRYLNGKVNVFPLYRISLKIDRNPVKIPWTIKEVTSQNISGDKSKYKYVAVKKVQSNKNIDNLYPMPFHFFRFPLISL